MRSFTLNQVFMRLLIPVILLMITIAFAPRPVQVDMHTRSGVVPQEAVEPPNEAKKGLQFDVVIETSGMLNRLELLDF